MATPRDQSLIPSTAVRLTALGILSEGDKRYGELAVEVRNFIARMIGPTLDVLGTSIELLRHEGLIEPIGRRAGPGQSLTADTQVHLTDAGRAALHELLLGQLRTPMNDISRLIVALKLRFLHLLEPEQRRSQIDMLIELTTSELARLADLRAHRPAGEEVFADWLGQEIAQTEARLAWYRQLAAKA
jgi:hypothetical protein